MGRDIQHNPAAQASGYDPFARGPHPVGVRSFQALDTSRERMFPCELWYPAAAQHAGQDVAEKTTDWFTSPPDDGPRSQAAVRDATPEPGTRPLVIYSHPSAGNRRSATFLTTHLSSHGYLVAALDHSEQLAPELKPTEGESEAHRAERIAGWIANRVPDIRFLLDHLLDETRGETPGGRQIVADPSRIAVVGHSFGGWTALEAADADPRIRTVVALAPGGSTRRRPGIIPATATLSGNREVPTLYLVADQDTSTPLDGMYELFERTPPPRRMLILHRADHLHFVDEVEHAHEAMRAIPATGELAWINEMRPIAELCSSDQAHLFVRGLTLAHLDATLRDNKPAEQLINGDIVHELARRGVEMSAS
jgi:dienelactone hydrolase